MTIWLSTSETYLIVYRTITILRFPHLFARSTLNLRARLQMDPIKCEDVSAIIACQEVHSDAATTLETIDAGKINSLLDFVRQRLTSDVFGNVNLQGDRLGKDSRHTKLREVIELSRPLEDVKGLMERKNKITAMEAAQDARKNPTPNVNQLATIQCMIKDEMEKGLRDVKIENARLTDRVLKAEERVKKAEAEHAALQENVRKLSSGQMKGLRSTVKEEVARSVREVFEQTKVKDRLAESEKNIKKATFETEAQIRAMEATLIKRLSDGTDTVNRHVNLQISDAKELTHLEVGHLRADYENDLDKASAELLRWRTEHNDKLHSCNLWATDVLTGMYSLSNACEERPTRHDSSDEGSDGDTVSVEAKPAEEVQFEVNEDATWAKRKIRTLKKRSQCE